jgi:hypothetical protein
MAGIVRSSWFLSVIAVLVLTATVLYGCGEQGQQSSAPQVTEQPSVGGFARGNPAVDASIVVQERNTEQLLAMPGVIGTGIGADPDGTPVLLVLTRTADTKAVPLSIEGVRTRMDVVGDVVAMAGFTGTYRPVPGGVSVGNANECASGTLGCIVLKSGVQYALSNNHVFARENAAAVGERINQPGRYDGKPRCAQTGQIATLAGFKSIVFSTSANNVIDAAIAAFVPGVSTSCAMVNNLYVPSNTTVSPSVGLAVKKVGRTSGLTSGTIAGINVTINVGYSHGTARFVNQIYVASSLIRSGDSGSLMVTQNGNNPVGLCFAGGSGSSFANPINDVLSFFNATVCNQ